MTNDLNPVWKEIENLHARGFRQKSECTCGPSSLSLVSMAMGIPGVSEESWISEDKKRWLAIDQFPVRGLALPELALAAELGLREKIEVSLRRAFPENEQVFHEDLKLASRAGHALILNFAQDTALSRPFTEQGNPHFSPVADLRGDSVLIADVDPEIKSAYWVPIRLVYQSMALTNPAFGIPRGWIVIRKREL